MSDADKDRFVFWPYVRAVFRLTPDQVTTNERAVLHALAMTCTARGVSDESVPQLMNETSLSKSSVMRVTAALQKKKLIAVNRYKHAPGKPLRTNGYRLTGDWCQRATNESKLLVSESNHIGVRETPTLTLKKKTVHDTKKRRAVSGSNGAGRNGLDDPNAGIPNAFLKKNSGSG